LPPPGRSHTRSGMDRSAFSGDWAAAHRPAGHSEKV
jgi:hypothetical protein